MEVERKIFSLSSSHCSRGISIDGVGDSGIATTTVALLPILLIVTVFVLLLQILPVNCVVVVAAAVLSRRMLLPSSSSSSFSSSLLLLLLLKIPVVFLVSRRLVCSLLTISPPIHNEIKRFMDENNRK